MPALPPPHAIKLETEVRPAILARSSQGEEAEGEAGQAPEAVSIKELKHGLEVANTRLIDMERHVNILSQRIERSSAPTAATFFTSGGGESMPQGEEGVGAVRWGWRETELQQRIAHLERLLVAQCEAQHANILAAQQVLAMAQEATTDAHSSNSVAIPTVLHAQSGVPHLTPPLPHHPPSIPTQVERGVSTGTTKVGVRGAENQGGGADRVQVDEGRKGETAKLCVANAATSADGHRSDAHADNVETMEAAVQDDALLVLHALESHGKGLEKENEWSSEEQRLVTFSAWPFSDNPRYPQVNIQRVAPSVTHLRVRWCSCVCAMPEGRRGYGG